MSNVSFSDDVVYHLSLINHRECHRLYCWTPPKEEFSRCGVSLGSRPSVRSGRQP
jgi:hypothetical protein